MKTAIVTLAAEQGLEPIAKAFDSAHEMKYAEKINQNSLGFRHVLPINFKNSPI